MQTNDLASDVRNRVHVKMPINDPKNGAKIRCISCEWCEEVEVRKEEVFLKWETKWVECVLKNG